MQPTIEVVYTHSMSLGNMEGYQETLSCERYAQLVEAELRQRYPQYEVNVIYRPYEYGDKIIIIDAMVDGDTEEQILECIVQVEEETLGGDYGDYAIPNVVVMRDLVQINPSELTPVDLHKEAVNLTSSGKEIRCYRIDKALPIFVVWLPDATRIGIATNGDAQWATVDDVLAGINLFIQDGETFSLRN